MDARGLPVAGIRGRSATTELGRDTWRATAPPIPSSTGEPVVRDALIRAACVAIKRAEELAMSAKVELVVGIECFNPEPFHRNDQVPGPLIGDVPVLDRRHQRPLVSR